MVRKNPFSIELSKGAVLAAPFCIFNQTAAIKYFIEKAS